MPGQVAMFISTWDVNSSDLIALLANPDQGVDTVLS
jgi:hypothetical protein